LLFFGCKRSLLGSKFPFATVVVVVAVSVLPQLFHHQLPVLDGRDLVAKDGLHSRIVLQYHLNLFKQMVAMVDLSGK
jgi:hypothetical protein